MKYAWPLIILFLSTQLMGQPYLNETSRWKQYTRYGVYPPAIEFIEDVVIRLDGDTIIDSQLYFKVLKTGFDTTTYLQNEGPDTHGTIYEYMDPIREGDLGIYVYSLAQQKEYLLYDFSANLGDTLKSGNCKRDTVILIDSVYLGDQPRKQFHLPSRYSVDISTLIEGIGSTFGFYWGVCNVITSPYVIRLQCFSQDGDFIQFDPTYDCNNWLLSDEVIPGHAFSIRPNPFIHEIEILFPDAFQQPVSITIVNLMGAVVFECQLSSVNSIEHIALPDLPAGMYVISVGHQDGFNSQKIMKL
jgi:hypothetical protein